MRCEGARLLIPQLLVGDLDPAKMPELETHLETCPACREELASMRSVKALLRDPSLSAMPSGDLKVTALARVAAEDLALALGSSPGPAPPADLKRRAITRALEASRDNRKRTTTATWIAAAAALIGIAFAVESRVEMQDLDRRADSERKMRIRAEAAVGPAGHPMQSFKMTGRGASADAQLVHFRHDNFRVTMTLKDFKPSPPDHHYEMWLKGHKGVVGLGTFRIVRPDELTVSFSVGVDPMDFPEVMATLEPNDGDPRMSKNVVARALLDRGSIHHGSYNE